MTPLLALGVKSPDISNALAQYDKSRNAGFLENVTNQKMDMAQQQLGMQQEAHDFKMQQAQVNAANAAQDRAAQKEKDLINTLFAFADRADTPAKWKSMINVLKKRYGDDSVVGFEDYSQRPNALNLLKQKQTADIANHQYYEGLDPDKKASYEKVNKIGGVKSVDTGTGTLLVDKSTGAPVREVSKDLRGKKKQEAEGKIMADQPAAVSRMKEAFAAGQRTIELAKNLSKHKGLDSATGPIDAYLPTVFGDTADFETDLETLKTQGFVHAINQMRELSKTGGALGSVTEREIEKMENSYRNLKLRQSEKNMRSNLENFAKDFEQSMKRIQQAYDRQYGSLGGQTKGKGKFEGWSIQKVD